MGNHGGKYSDSDRLLQYNKDDDKTISRQWYVSGSKEDSNFISSTVRASGLQFEHKNNSLYVTASIDQMTILFNLCLEIRIATCHNPKVSLDKNSVESNTELTPSPCYCVI